MGKYEVACVHWSNWHPTEAHNRKYGYGWTEWEYLKNAVPRYVGHRQPLVPLWGYYDDSLTENAAMQIEAAADNGITSFLYVWGWDESLPQLGHPTIDAFLRAPNRGRMKFELMWCAGRVDDMEAAADYMIGHYFTKPEYLFLHGGPYVAIYELFKFVRENGGVDSALQKLECLRRKVREAGLGELQLIAMEWGIQASHAADFDGDINGFLRRAGVVGMTSYTWAHNVFPYGFAADGSPASTLETSLYGPYSRWSEDAMALWEGFEREHGLPYYPNVSTGWDPSPRCLADQPYRIGGPLMYRDRAGNCEVFHTPYLSSIVDGNTPELFENALRKTRDYLDRHDLPVRMCTLYAWNEWTEGGHLEPDQYYGYGWLHAIRNVFGAGK